MFDLAPNCAFWAAHQPPGNRGFDGQQGCRVPRDFHQGASTSVTLTDTMTLTPCSRVKVAIFSCVRPYVGLCFFSVSDFARWQFDAKLAARETRVFWRKAITSLYGRGGAAPDAEAPSKQAACPSNAAKQRRCVRLAVSNLAGAGKQQLKLAPVRASVGHARVPRRKRSASSAVDTWLIVHTVSLLAAQHSYRLALP